MKTIRGKVQGNAQAGRPGDGAREADAVLLAVHWSRVGDVRYQAGDLWGKMFVTWPLPVDAGPPRIARFIEPFALLVGQLAYEGKGGPELAYRFEWLQK